MKKVLLLTPLFLFGVTFSEIKNDITNSLIYKIAQKKSKIEKSNFDITKTQKYGKIDISYNAIDFFTQPYIKTITPVAVENNQLIYKEINVDASDKFHYMAEIKYSYPIFNKLLNVSINKSKLKYIKKRLNIQNTKRIIFLQVAQIYSNIYALKENIKALQSAKKALNLSKIKAKAFYESGLLDKSNYDEINAKYYEVLANIAQLKSDKNNLLDKLSYILNKKIKKISNIYVNEKILKPHFQNRADIKMIKKDLKISDKNIALAKSNYYPEIGLEVGLKREADNFVLTKNDYSNIDKSYIALGIKYEFDGSKKYQLEQAKIAKNINLLFYQDYLNKIKTEYKSDLNIRKTLIYQLKAAKEEIKARESYYDYIQAKFNEGLSDSSDLNEAIAKLAESKAKKEYIQAQIFFINQKLLINGGFNVFSK